MKTLAALAALGLAGVLLGCSHAADEQAPQLSVTPDSVAPGGSITVRSAGLDDLSDQQLRELRSAPMSAFLAPGHSFTLPTPTLDERGAFTQPVTLPAGIEPGRWTVSWDVPCKDTNASCAGVTAQFVVKV